MHQIVNVRRCRWFACAAMTMAAACAFVFAVLGDAPSAHGQSRQASSDLRPLVNNLTKQLRLAYRHDLPEYSRRFEQLRAAIRSWNESAQSETDHQKMSVWLRESIHNSMPGLARPLPPPPEFGAVARVESDQKTVTVRKPITPAKASGSSTANSMVAATAEAQSNEARSTDQATSASSSDNPTDDEAFWKRHPAANDLPAEFSEGDPFRDDPLFAMPIDD